MPFGTLSNRRPYTKQCIRSSPHHNIRQVHRRKSSDDDNVLHRFFLPGLSNHLELHPDQLDLHRNASLSLAPIWSFGFLLDLRTHLFALRTQPLTLYATELIGHLCGIFRSGIICRSSTCRGMRLDHPRTLPSGKEWPVGWTQPDLLPCAVVSLVISIGQGVLTRWRRSGTSKARLDGTGLWGLPETIGPDVCTRLERFWNDWELGRDGLPWSPK